MGYDTKRFEDPPPDAIICSICLEVYEEPVMCPDDHVYCNGCIISSLESCGMCPEDKKEMDKDQLKRSRVLKQIIDELRLSCRFSNVGCDDVTTVEQENVHALSCKFRNSYDKESDTGRKLERLTDEQNLLVASFTKNAAILDELQRNVGNFEEFYQSKETELFSVKENIKFEFESVKNLLNKKCSKTEHSLKKHNDNVEELLDKIVKIDEYFNHFKEDISCLQERLDHLEKLSMEPIEGIVKNKMDTEPSVSEINDKVIEQLRSMIGKSKGCESSKENQTKSANLFAMSSVSTSGVSLSPEKVFPSRVFTQSNPKKSSKGSSAALMEDIFVKSGSNEDLIHLGPVKKPVTPSKCSGQFLTPEDFGVETFAVSDGHKSLVSRLRKSRLVKPGPILELLDCLDFTDHFPPQTITYSLAQKTSSHMKHIASIVKKGMKVQLINGNSYLALCAAILAGKTGSVYCCNFGRGIIGYAGFDHLLKCERLNFITVSNFHASGHPGAAPYDLILVNSPTKLTKAIKVQLAKDGIAFDYAEGYEIKDDTGL